MEWRKANPEKAAAIAKASYERNKGKRLAAAKAWRDANSEKKAAYMKVYRMRHKEKLAAQEQLWVQANPDKVAMRNAKRRARKLRATPAWADREAIASVYEQAQSLRNAGFDVHVDHIVPLKSKLVCGLHVEHNLRVLPARENYSKQNRYWPDMP